MTTSEGARCARCGEATYLAMDGKRHHASFFINRPAPGDHAFVPPKEEP